MVIDAAESFETLPERLRTVARDYGLIPIDALPSMAPLPTVLWPGDWHSFLACARDVPVRLLYIAQEQYDPENVADELLRDLGLSERATPMEEEEADQLDSDQQRIRWVRERLHEQLRPWEPHIGTASRLTASWVHQSIQHLWMQWAPWSADIDDAIDALTDEIRQVEQEHQTIRSAAAAHALHTAATEMAHHPHFSDAASEEKREFMASQLFAHSNVLTLLGSRAPLLIARRAVLIYWWEVEVAEKVTKHERAKQLHAQGESIRNIAAILKLSEAKVRAAIFAEASSTNRSER